MWVDYSEGPKCLIDVSYETTQAVVELVHEGYGDDHISKEVGVSIEAVEEIRTNYKNKLRRCSFCGCFFKPLSPRQMNCKKEHFVLCTDCGKRIPVKGDSYGSFVSRGGPRCWDCRGKRIGETRRSKSQEEKDAIVAKQQATMVERYGAPTALQVPEMKVKIQATVKERYGVDNLSQSAEIQEKIKKNSQERYGVDHYSNAPEIRQKMIDGMVEKYGVTHAQKSAEIQQRTKKTVQKRYGVDNVMQNEEIKQHFIESLHKDNVN